MRILFLLLVVSTLNAQTRRDQAVFFPVTSYTGGWAQLPNTLPECTDLATDLQSLYGFQTEVLADKTKQEIKAKLAELGAKSYGPDDQLLLFFSMHGYFDEAGEVGCLCPAGAKTDDPSFDTWLLHTELRALVSRIPCEHILIVIDACYSGTFGGKKGRPDEAAYKEGPDCQANIRQALQRKTRRYIAAGAKERVPADSELVKKMRSALGGYYTGEDGILSLQELLGVLSEARPEPKDGAFTGDLGGGFVFVPKNGCTPASDLPDPDLAAWNHARSQKTEAAYQFYLDSRTSGRYRAEAQQALRRIQEERIWQAALKNGSAAAFQSYLASYCPGGLYCAEATEKTKADSRIEADDGLVLVKGGTYTMGCTSEQQDCGSDEKPVRQVTVSDFYIGKYEVTQRLWKEVMGTKPSNRKNCGDCPVESVNWDEVQDFLKKLNAKYPGRNYRLPTEAEWEYAARGGGKQVLFGNGKNVADPAEINFNASDSNKKSYSLAGTHRKKTIPVGSLNSPNALGLHDMSGNVWEWCSDWKGDYPSGSQTNPTGPSSGFVRVIRGGSWLNYPQSCRVAMRGSGNPGFHVNFIGFRLARTN